MGFDNECILNIQSLAGEYFCPVCRMLVYPNEALQSQCTHLYCKPCLTYIVGTTRACPYDGYLVTEADSKPLVESNKALAETIGKISVHCLYHRSGCTWQGPFSECTSHCSGCTFGNSPVVCNRCGIQIVHRQVQEHAQNCPGVQPQAQQAQGAQDTAATGATAAPDQSQTAAPSGPTISQAQASQSTTAPPPGQDPSSQASANPQPAAVPATVPTPEQWYQQQYQQYYQQFPGYDPYQQTYQQYFPYQQQAIQQYQQHPQNAQGQNQPQVYSQPQPQPQAQPKPQSQPHPQAQAQSQGQAPSQPHHQAQPQPQTQTQPQSQPHQHVQAPVAAQHQNQTQANPQQQLHPAVQPHSLVQSQTQPPLQGHPHPQPYPQSQPHPIQPQPQQHMQMPQYQQSHAQMQHPQPQVQPQFHSLSQTQGQPPAQLPHHPQSHPQFYPPHQSSQPPNAQSQTQHLSATAVTGYHSYPQPHGLQQVQLGAQQQHLMHMQPQSGPMPQHPAQLHGQFPQQLPQIRPPQSHVPMPNQQQPSMLPLQGPVPPAQQQVIHPHAQPPSHPVHQRPVMQPVQQPLPQQFLQQQQQSFPGQTSGPVQGQLPQQGPFVQQHHSMQSQLRPQAQPHPVQQNSHVHMQSQHFVHGMAPHQSQNYVGRPMMSNNGAQSQSFPQSPGGFAGAAQVRPMQLGGNQPSVNQVSLPRTSNQMQTSSEQQLVQSGLIPNPTVSERKGDHLSDKSVAEQSAGSPSHKTVKTDSDGVVLTSGLGADSVEARTLKSETDVNLMDDECRPTVGDEDKTSTLGKDADSGLQTAENGPKGPSIKHMVKKEGTESSESLVEPSSGGKSSDVVAEEQKVASNVPKEVEHSSMNDASSQKVESLKEQSGKLPKDATDAGLMSSTGADKGSQAIPLGSDNVAPQGSSHNPLIGKDQYLEKNSSQSQLTQGPGVDEFKGFPPNGHVQGKGFMDTAHPVPLTDQGRHQQPPTHYGPSSHQQRPAAPSMLSMPPQGPPHHALIPGQPSTMARPQGPGHFPQLGQPVNPPEHFQPHVKQPYGSFLPDFPSGGIPGPGSTSLFGKGPGHIGLSQRSFEQQSSAQGYYNQGHMPPSNAGPPRISQGEPPVGSIPQGALPPGSFDPHGGIMGRAPPHGPEGQFRQQHPMNPLENETFPNHRSRHFDGRQPDSYPPGNLERVPFGQPSGIESNPSQMNGAPGVDSSSNLGLRDERFKLEGRLNSFSSEPARQIDESDFQGDLKMFPGRSHLDTKAAPKFGSFFSSSRPTDGGPHAFPVDAASGPLDKPPFGFNVDAGLKLDTGAGTAPSRFLPPYHPSSTLHPNDVGERIRPVGPDDNFGRADMSRNHPDFLGPVGGFGRRHMDRLAHRSPGREYPGIPPHGFGGNIDSRELHPFDDGSRSFNLPADPVGNPFHDSRFPVLPSHLRRGELDGLRNVRGGELIGQDIPPSHLRRGEFLGPRKRFGEPAGFGVFPGHARMGELAGPGNFPHHLPFEESFGGNKSSHPRLGEPGFRSSYSLQGFPSDGGFYMGGRDSFDNSRKRKPGSMGWCRICKVDCETVEGLDMHSQTRDHQKMAMDMVLSIKQQNSKKQKTSNDHSSLEEAGKSRGAGYEGRGNKP